MKNNSKRIFKSGSRTYVYSSLYFPKKIRQEVTTLYAFVRIADNFVDSIPQQQKEFFQFKDCFELVWSNRETTYLIEKENFLVIKNFVILAKAKKFDKSWIDAFLKAMEADTYQKNYKTITELENYIYGSACVIGLMMSKLMGLPEDSFKGASQLGKSMQYINFIRDLAEDQKLGRNYLPIEELCLYNLEKLTEDYVNEHKEAYCSFIKAQIKRYFVWQNEAEEAFSYIPLRYLIPIKTASLMYNYTAQKIKKEPLIVFKKKVKPSILFIIKTGITVSLSLIWKKYLTSTKV